jgi:hypothetical protein
MRFGFEDSPVKSKRTPATHTTRPHQHHHRLEALDSEDTWQGEFKRIILSPKKLDSRPIPKSAPRPPAAQSSIVRIIKDKNTLLNVEETIVKSRSIDEDERKLLLLAQQQKKGLDAKTQQQKKELDAKTQQNATAVKLEKEREEEKVKADLLKAQTSAPTQPPVLTPQSKPKSIPQYVQEAAVFIDEVKRIKTQVKPGLKADRAALKAFHERKVVINTRYLLLF